MRLSMRMIVVLLSMVGILIILVIGMEEASGATIIVAQDGNGDYENIQDAIDNATSGDTIRVWEGTYYENLMVNKTVSLIGNGSKVTTIDAGKKDSVVKITADWVNISGFLVTGGGENSLDSGILIESNNTRIFNNVCEHNDYGIFLFSSSNSTLTNNTCNSNNFYVIITWSSRDCTIEDNTCNSNFWAGITLSISSFCSITNNTCNSNIDDGIRVFTSTDCTVTHNTISDNNWGINYKTSSGDNTAHYNNIYNNTEYGIHAIENNEITVNATYNYWGAASGPYHPTKNSDGEGDNITDYVIFEPWFEEKVKWKPEAHIDYISMHLAVEGESIRFAGHGTVEGSIIGYAWRSSIDGEFYKGIDSEIEYDELSNDTHTIYFKVQAKWGVWSDEVSDTLTVNGKPQAHIDSISPEQSVEGQTVSFEGHGTDDGSIKRYLWRTEDREFYNGTNSSFTLSTLPIGTHTIYLQVQDNYGVWSEKVKMNVTMNNNEDSSDGSFIRTCGAVVLVAVIIVIIIIMWNGSKKK